MLVKASKIIKKAFKEGYALGAFNTSNLEVTQGIVRAGVAKRSPVTIQVSETTIEYAGLETITEIIRKVAEREGKNIPIAFHLDHGKKFESVVRCIDAGFTSVMIDGSELPFQENLNLTREAAKYAHERNVWIQGELGKIIKSRLTDEPGAYENLVNFMTDPDKAKEFVKETRVDSLAISIGNVHGLYQGELKLDFDRLREIRRAVKVPLVLHGGSGIPAPSLKKAIQLGITKVNIDTDIRIAFTSSVRDFMAENLNEYDPRKVLVAGRDAVQRLVEEKIEVLGSAGKA